MAEATEVASLREDLHEVREAVHAPDRDLRSGNERLERAVVSLTTEVTAAVTEVRRGNDQQEAYRWRASARAREAEHRELVLRAALSRALEHQAHVSALGEVLSRVEATRAQLGATVVRVEQHIEQRVGRDG